MANDAYEECRNKAGCAESRGVNGKEKNIVMMPGR